MGDKLVNRLYKIAFPDGDSDFDYNLWKLSGGCRAEAFYIIKELGYSHRIYVTDELFDCVLLKVNGGVSVDWETLYWNENESTHWEVMGQIRVKKIALNAIDRYFKQKEKYD